MVAYGNVVGAYCLEILRWAVYLFAYKKRLFVENSRFDCGGFALIRMEFHSFKNEQDWLKSDSADRNSFVSRK